jgi:hypothetical protein
MSVFSKIRSWFVVPAVVLASFATAPAQGQLTCESPLDAGLGTTEFAALLSFPGREVSVSCSGSSTVHHALYHRFTAPEDGWYAIYAFGTGSAWSPRIAVLAACDSVAAEPMGYTHNGGYPLCDMGDWTHSQHASATAWIAAGESRIVVLGGATTDDGGHGKLVISRIGATLMDGAQPLGLGSSQFVIAPLEPTLPYQGGCPQDRMDNASRFTFTPTQTGDYRFGFCGSYRATVRLSDSPNLHVNSFLGEQSSCPQESAGRVTATLQAGTTYYLAAGWAYHWDACYTRNVTVEYFDPCPADLNDDDSVDGKDLAILISGWGTAEADITNDGNTDGVDLGILLASWGVCTG